MKLRLLSEVLWSVSAGQVALADWTAEKPEARGAEAVENGFVAKSDYIDRTAPDGPLVVQNETATVTVADFETEFAVGYSLDIETEHRCATQHLVGIVKYRYSGFTVLATSDWSKETSSILTSTGHGRFETNFASAA